MAGKRAVAVEATDCHRRGRRATVAVDEIKGQAGAHAKETGRIDGDLDWRRLRLDANDESYEQCQARQRLAHDYHIGLPTLAESSTRSLRLKEFVQASS